jgi:hypothetical protein
MGINRYPVGTDVQVARRNGVPAMGTVAGYTDDASRVLVRMFIDGRLEWVSAKRVVYTFV